MQCYHPIKIKYDSFRFVDIFSFNTNFKPKRKFHIDSKTVFYPDSNTTLDLDSGLSVTKRQIYVPCGRCYACRVRSSNEWSMRVSQELFMQKNKGLFVTLTYNNDFLPRCGSVKKSELQHFFKRLRYHYKKHCIKYGIDYTPLKYFAVGEYGMIKNRAHYHFILMGYNTSNTVITKLINRSWSFEQTIYDFRTCKKKKDYISFGWVKVGFASPKSITYCAKYMVKDYDLQLGVKEYRKKLKKEAPFRLVSLGLGKSFLYKYIHNFIDNLYIVHDGFKLPIPRTYLRWIRNYLGSPKYNEIIQSKINKYKEINFTLLLEEHNIKANIEDYMFNEDIYNILNQSELLPFYLHKLQDIEINCIAKHKEYYQKKYNEAYRKRILNIA